MTAQLDFLPGLRPDLREIAPPSQPHRPTSVAAAERIKFKAGSQTERVLRYVRKRMPEGATHLETSVALGLPINIICARFKMLRDCGYVRDSGWTRANEATKMQAVVWVAA